MSSSRNTTRRPATLTPKTEKAVFNYSVVAGAAGVSLLALAQPTEAKIVYTPARTVVSPNGSLKIDLNGDGIDDFTLTEFGFAANRVNTGSTHSGGALNVSGAQSANQVFGVASVNIGYASALAAKVSVGASDPFLAGKSQLMEACLIMQGSTLVDRGKWINAKNKYLGLKFVIRGQTHFGWTRLSVRRSGCAITTVLTGYAYETVAKKSIPTGKTSGPVEAADLISPSNAPVPPALGLLAQGADGLAIWRKEQEPITSK